MEGQRQQEWGEWFGRPTWEVHVWPDGRVGLQLWSVFFLADIHNGETSAAILRRELAAMAGSGHRPGGLWRQTDVWEPHMREPPVFHRAKARQVHFRIRGAGCGVAWRLEPATTKALARRQAMDLHRELDWLYQRGGERAMMEGADNPEEDWDAPDIVDWYCKIKKDYRAREGSRAARNAEFKDWNRLAHPVRRGPHPV